MSNLHRKPRKRPNEPIAPATIPGQPLDPKIPPELAPGSDEERDDLEDRGESDEEGQTS